MKMQICKRLRPHSLNCLCLVDWCGKPIWCESKKLYSMPISELKEKTKLLTWTRATSIFLEINLLIRTLCNLKLHYIQMCACFCMTMPLLGLPIVEMNRHHYSLYVHNCRLVFLLRRDFTQLDTFRPAEFHWKLEQVWVHICVWVCVLFISAYRFRVIL